MEEFDASSLDKKLQEVIKYLKDHNFQPIDAGDGKSASISDLNFPHVVITIHAADLVSESHRLWDLVQKRYPKASVEASYSPEEESALLILFYESGEMDSNPVEQEWN